MHANDFLIDAVLCNQPLPSPFCILTIIYIFNEFVLVVIYYDIFYENGETQSAPPGYLETVMYFFSYKSCDFIVFPGLIIKFVMQYHSVDI